MADSYVQLGRNFSETDLKAVDIGSGLHALAVQLIAGGAVVPYGWNYAPGAADGVTSGSYIGLPIVNSPLMFNGSTWDRRRGNAQSTLLASAARTLTTATALQTNYNNKGVLLFFNISAIPGAGSLTLSIEGVDPISGNTITMLTGAALNTTGLRVYGLYPTFPNPAAAMAGMTLAQAGFLPRSWQARITAATGDSYTYSLGGMELS